MQQYKGPVNKKFCNIHSKFSLELRLALFTFVWPLAAAGPPSFLIPRCYSLDRCGHTHNYEYVPKLPKFPKICRVISLLLPLSCLLPLCRLSHFLRHRCETSWQYKISGKFILCDYVLNSYDYSVLQNIDITRRYLMLITLRDKRVTVTTFWLTQNTLVWLVLVIM